MKEIDFSEFTRVQPEGSEARREPRPQPEKERNPTYFQRSQEREGKSEWSGGSMGGGTWGGRSR